MKNRNDNCSQRAAGKCGERGASITEVMIVVVMIGVVTAFAVMQIGGAQRAMRLTNSAREFMSWLDKTRLDSVRRHAMSSSEMANITISSANSYTITLDQDGDGTLDPPRSISIPGTYGVSFVGTTLPLTIRYNWRGRPVDATGNPLNLAFRLEDANSNVSPINLTSMGDTSLGDNINTSNVNVSTISNTANIKAKTYDP